MTLPKDLPDQFDDDEGVTDLLHALLPAKVVVACIIGVIALSVIGGVVAWGGLGK